MRRLNQSNEKHISHLNTISMYSYLPYVLQYHVHGSPVVKLLFKLHALSRHLYTDKHIQQLLRQVFYQRMLHK